MRLRFKNIRLTGRRTLLVLTVGLLVCAAGVSYKLVRKWRQAHSSDAGYSSTEGYSSYEQMLAATRTLCRHPLDTPPECWGPPERAVRFSDPGTITFTADDIPAEFSSDEIERARKEDALVR